MQLTGQKWAVIAALLPGRTDDAVRNRYLRLQRKKHGDGFADCRLIGEAGATHLANRLPQALTELRLDLGGSLGGAAAQQSDVS